MSNLKTLELIVFVEFVILFGILASQQEIIWNGNWALVCNFSSLNLKVEKTLRENCETRCASVYGCSHYVWTNFDNGTCWMKKGLVTKKNVTYSNDNSALCGIVDTHPIIFDIKTTQHGYINDEGACLLPQGEYTVNYPVALGSYEALDYLKFRPQLCGHIIEVNCGTGSVDLIIMNSNLGGGLDLYDSIWDKIAKNKSREGVARCSVQLTKKNPLRSGGYKCYHATDQTDNEYFRSVGLFNTYGRVIISAELNGRNGFAADNGYYNFYVYAIPDDKVTFNFEFGGSFSVSLGDCPSNLHKQKWS